MAKYSSIYFPTLTRGFIWITPNEPTQGYWLHIRHIKDVALKLRNVRNLKIQVFSTSTNDAVLSVSGLYSVYLEYTIILLVIDTCIWCHKMHGSVRTQVRGVTVYWIRSQMQTRACPQMPLINEPIKCSAVKCTLYLECTLQWTLYSYCLNLIIYRMNSSN